MKHLRSKNKKTSRKSPHIGFVYMLFAYWVLLSVIVVEFLALFSFRGDLLCGKEELPNTTSVIHIIDAND